MATTSSSQVATTPLDILLNEHSFLLRAYDKTLPEDHESDAVKIAKQTYTEMLEALQYAVRFLRPEDADRDYIKGIILKAKGGA
jgi:predicted RNase H-like nuclease (RuvC/YqgF family)